jgi:hypothetical protein
MGDARRGVRAPPDPASGSNDRTRDIKRQALNAAHAGSNAAGSAAAETTAWEGNQRRGGPQCARTRHLGPVALLAAAGRYAAGLGRGSAVRFVGRPSVSGLRAPGLLVGAAVGVEGRAGLVDGAGEPELHGADELFVASAVREAEGCAGLAAAGDGAYPHGCITPQPPEIDS